MGILDAPGIAPTVRGQDVLRTQNDAALRVFRSALAGSKRGKQQATICVFGDSKSEGQNDDAGATFEDVWTRYMLAGLRARWNPAGVVGGVGFIPAKYAYAQPTGQGFALSGVLGTDYSIGNTFGPGARNVNLRTTSGSMSYTQVFTRADLCFYNSTAGTKIDVTIDGVTTTYTTNSTGSNQKITVASGLASVPHVITIKQGASSPGWAVISGVDFFNGDETAGVRLMDASHYGYTTTQALSILGNMTPAINLASPDLVILKLGTNDYSAIDAATFGANLLQILSTHANSFHNKMTKVPSYLIVIPESRASMVSTIAEYVDAAYSVAQQMPVPCGVLDLSLRMPQSSGSSPLGLWSTDGIHENSRGHQFVADAVQSVIVGDRLGSPEAPKDATGRRLDTFQAAPTRKATIVLFGDSRTADCGYNVAPNGYTTNMDWFGWGNYSRPGGPTLDVVNNAGIGGNTTTQMLARMQTDVLAYTPGYMTIWGGTNDGWAAIADVDASYGRMVQMINLARAAGIYVFLISETTANSKGTTFPKHVAYYNDRLRQFAAATPGVEFWDFNSLITDPANVNGYNKSAMLRDGLHLGPFGASTIGRQIVAPALAKLPWNLVSLPVSQSDHKGVFADSHNIITNSLMAGTGGTVGSGHTGTLPDGWSSSGNVCALSVQARADGVGNDIKLVLSASSTSSVFLSRTLTTAHVVPGKTYQIEASLGVDAVTDVASIALTMLATIGGTAYRRGVGYPVQSTASGDAIAPGEYILRSQPFTLPAGTISGADVSMRIGPSAASASATVRLGRVAIRQLD